ncbi:NAD(P)/FAD-dependent oxidoreductase [Halanaerobium hydrogeniformans]|uniref:FAD dependent oxidoreductase n=1 Tax=Halanaerobium hydrogeniformans TaxID=656519 RepID=E4RMQ6_HALHG|nr:NAD(P)/FAD-dependent oxidoreductase [Halanaerobium hydrogeniformans]ADQ14587.1 FAD dependent oxidoreductase [Halanaerobium hydrogeniformans]
MKEHYDIVIIGAGAIGSAIARELSRYKLDVLLLEKNVEIGGEATTSNSAIIHTGYDAKPGTLESKLVVGANPMYDQLCDELDVPFKKVGAILAAVTEEELKALPQIMKKSYQNGVYDIEYLTGEEIKRREKDLSDDVKGGIYIPRESIIDPFILNIAYAENAYTNGVDVSLSTKVTDIKTADNRVKSVVTNKGEINCDYIVNAAGVYCDQIAEMVNLCDFKEHPRKGEFFILDKNVSYELDHIILPVPTKLTKGKLITPTIHGNLLLGPTAEDIEDKKDKSTTREGLESIIEDVQKRVPKVSARDSIKQYAGLRPTRTPEGYHIESYDLKGFIGLSGIRSTGLTSSPSVAKYVVDLLNEEGVKLIADPDFNPNREGIRKFSELSWSEKEELKKENSKYGQLICRCEEVPEAEIIAAINRPLGATTLDGIKRRVRPGAGRCQGGFCKPRILKILARELNIPVSEILKKEKGSKVISRSKI